MSTEATFEEKLAQIEKLASQLEQGSLPFDQAMTHYKTGLELIAQCKEYLKSTKNELEQLQQQYTKEIVSPSEKNDTIENI